MILPVCLDATLHSANMTGLHVALVAPFLRVCQSNRFRLRTPPPLKRSEDAPKSPAVGDRATATALDGSSGATPQLSLALPGATSLTAAPVRPATAIRADQH